MASIAVAFDDRHAFALRAMHDSPRGGIEGIAPVHHTPVVPYEDVADAPLVMPREMRLGGVRPQRLEQRFGFVERKSVHISVRAPADVQRIAARLRVPPHDRV